MVGAAIERHPDLAREIVLRGHEVAARAKTWESLFVLPREEWEHCRRRQLSTNSETASPATVIASEAMTLSKIRGATKSAQSFSR
jgi:peptidoglycan/xylan/chitin deacetylase (PgdA/CDA1 family)